MNLPADSCRGRPWCGAGRLLARLLPLALAVPGLGQRPPQRQLCNPVEFTTSQDDNLFSLVRSQEQIHLWQVALTELEAGDFAAAVQRLHGVMQADTGGVVPVSPGRFLGLRLAVVQTLANLPPAAAAAYEDLVRREAGALADVDLTTLPPAQLERLADRFAPSPLGLAARLRLGDLAFEAGDGLTAAGHFRAAFDATRFGSRDEARVAERLHLAGVLDDPRAARAAAGAEPLPAAVDDLLAVLPPLAVRNDYPAIGGGRAGRTPMAPPAGDLTARRWTEDIAAPGFQRNDHGELAMFPVGDLDGIFINTGRELLCFDALRHAFAWATPSPMRDDADADDGSGGDRGRSRRRFNPDAEVRLNPDTVLAAAVGDDVVVAVLQVPDNSQNINFNGGLRVISKLALRRTFAFARSSGKLLWSHFDSIDGPRTRRFRGHDACGPPLVAGDTVYVPVHDRSGAIAFAVAAYDLRTGQPKWRRLVCSSQQEVNMFGNANMEFAASPLALADGVLFGASNLGVCYAIDARTGALRWVSSHEVVVMPKTVWHRQEDRPVYFANNAPAVTGGTVCLTPLDSPYALGFDVEGGELLWRLSFDAVVDRVANRVMWLAGCLGDEFVLSGAGAVAVKARPATKNGRSPEVRQLVHPEALGSLRDAALPGRPALTSDGLWFSRYGRLLPFDRDGNPRPPVPVQGLQPGNLLLVDGIVVSLRQRNFDLMLDAAALRQQVEARHRAAPDDPAAILRLATLRRALLAEAPAEADLAALQALYRRGLDGCRRRNYPPSHPVRLALQRELFDHARATAMAALQRDAAETDRLLAAARDDAPDQRQWLEMQALLLQRCRSDLPRFCSELDRLERQAPTALFPYGEGVPVRCYVLWQRALAAEAEPAAAVALWQQLLEGHGEVDLGGETAAAAAEANLQRLMQSHGASVYAAVAARADRALAEAGDDDQALERLTQRFPNSQAARNARLRLLDAAVRRGDLRVASEVLAQGLRGDGPAPGVLRRVLVAAERRGNLALAAAMAALLRPFASTPSDWPDDQGADYGTVLARRGEAPAPPVAGATLPAAIVARINPRRAGEYPRQVDTIDARGFAPRGDRLLYLVSGRELVAYEVPAGGAPPVATFATAIDFIDRVYRCGDVLVLPDMERLQGLDHRTGTVLWSLPNDSLRQLECLGVEGGVLQMQAHPAALNGTGEVFGVEPTSGVVLWRRPMTADQLRAKQVEGQVLLFAIGPDGVHVDGLDPVTGRVVRSLDLDSALQTSLRLDRGNLTTGLYPLAISADQERLYLPVEGANGNEPPRLFAVDRQGAIAWQWQGTAGLQLEMVARRGDRLVIVERSEQRPGRIVLLRTGDGSEQRTAVVGPDAMRLNWERALVPNPAPPFLAVSAIADLQSRQRELFCFPVEGDGPVFVYGLGNEDGEVQPAPVFGRTAAGADFVAFGVQPLRSGAPARLYVLDLVTRKGVLPGGAPYLRLETASRPQVAGFGAYTVVTSRQGLLLLRSPDDPK